MEDLLLRLDFENSTDVQAQLVRLLFRSYCPALIEGVDYINRFRRVRHMCSISRNASLNLHRLIYPMKLVTIEQAVNHIRSLLLGTKAQISKIPTDGTGQIDDKLSQEGSDELRLDVSNATNMFNEPEEGEAERSPEVEKQLSVVKDILDSAIVLWKSIRNDLYDSKNVRFNEELMKGMANMVRSLEEFKDTPLRESALVIASHLARDRVEKKLFNHVLAKIQFGDLSDRYFAHYLDAFANWDVVKLLEIVMIGLKQLRNVVGKASGMPDTPLRTPRKGGSPPMKKVRMDATPLRTPARKAALPQAKSAKPSDDSILYRPIEIIRMFLSSPYIMLQLTSQNLPSLVKFCSVLREIREAFGRLIKSDELGGLPVGGRTLVSAYDILTVLSIITISCDMEEDDVSMNEGESNGYNPTRSDRLLLDEVDWLESVLEVRRPRYQVAEMFLRNVNLHLVSGKISSVALEKLGSILMKVKDNFDDLHMPKSLSEAIIVGANQLAESLTYSDDEETRRRVLEEVVHPINRLEDTTREMDNDQ